MGFVEYAKLLPNDGKIRENYCDVLIRLGQ